MSGFRLRAVDPPGLVLIEPNPLRDARGFFMETYRRSEFVRAGLPEVFVQDNHARSLKHVLRGLHYQKRPHEQGKLVRVVVGEIYDVAVDLRRRAPTYGQWWGGMLSAENQLMLYVPPEFAHGYCVLSEIAEVEYKVTREHAPEAERGVAWNDPDLRIPWPVTAPLLSPRDAALPRLRTADHDFE